MRDERASRDAAGARFLGIGATERADRKGAPIGKPCATAGNIRTSFVRFLG
jgi:hypothetical protein